MYARHTGASGVPQNYSGNAFRYPPIGPLVAKEEPPEQTMHLSDREPSEQPKRPLPAPAAEPVEREVVPAPRGLTQSIGQWLGSEELLLIGLFLLLSGHNDKDGDGGGDLLFYLLLLLFCG